MRRCSSSSTSRPSATFSKFPRASIRPFSARAKCFARCVPRTSSSPGEARHRSDSRRALRHAVEVGKRARTETSIARGTTSLAHVAVELAAEHLGGSFDDKRVVVVGAGEMGESLVSTLAPLVQRATVVVANRSVDKAVELGKSLHGRGLSLDTLSSELADADVVFARPPRRTCWRAQMMCAACARVDTAAPADRRCRRSARFRSRRRAAPRRFAPRRRRPARLCRAEDRVVRRAEIDHVVEIIDDELDRYALGARSRDAAPLITALRSRARMFAPLSSRASPTRCRR